jgi:hypothetical protein
MAGPDMNPAAACSNWASLAKMMSIFASIRSSWDCSCSVTLTHPPFFFVVHDTLACGGATGPPLAHTFDT